MDGAQMGVASDWVGLSLGGFWVSAGVSVGWSTDSVTDSRTGTDGRRANGSRFGLGGLVPTRILGFGGRVRGGSRPRMKNHEHLRLRQVQV